MSQTSDMNETAAMLAARLALYERIRTVEHALAHAEQARAAGALMRERSHELGNAIQIVKLGALELARRLAGDPEVSELLPDITAAADQATRVLADMVAATRPVERAQLGAVISHTVRAAIEVARPAFLSQIELRVELDDTVHSYCTTEELETIVFAATLEAAGPPRTTSGATRMTFVVRERQIQGKRWVELLRIDDRQMHDGDYAHMFEQGSLLKLVADCAKACGGEASLAPGRAGLELAVELPVVTLADARP